MSDNAKWVPAFAFALAIVASRSALAQAPAPTSPLELARQLNAGTHAWSDPNCADARNTGFASARDKPAKQRYASLKAYKQCLLQAKSFYATAAGDPVTMQFQAEAATQAEMAKTDTALEAAEAETSFMGISFGVGVGVSYSQDEVVSEADLGPGNVIIPTKSEREIPRVILESHYYGWCNSKTCNAGTFGVGPYFGIVAKTDKLISAFSTGAMFGWKDTNPAHRQGFSIGVGVVLDDAVKSLATGFEAGQPLPAGETTIRFEEKARWSAILFFTRTF